MTSAFDPGAFDSGAFDTGAPAAIVPGAVLELIAAKADGGTGPGVNSPFTTDWADTSGHGNDGTLTNMAGTPASGWAGSGTAADPYRLVFDGVNDYVAVPSLDSAGTQVFTYEAWINTTNINHQTIIRESGTIAYARIFMLDGGQPEAVVCNDAGTTAEAYSAGAASLSNGSWHHVVWSCGGGYGQIYVDGASVGSPVALPGGATTLTTTVIGNAPGSTTIFAGFIAVARIYPFALTADQVAQNYAAGVAVLIEGAGDGDLEALGAGSGALGPILGSGSGALWIAGAGAGALESMFGAGAGALEIEGLGIGWLIGPIGSGAGRTEIRAGVKAPFVTPYDTGDYAYYWDGSQWIRLL